MTSAFSRAGRSGGSQALQLPRASNSCGSSAFRLHSACAQQKSENSVPVLRSPIRGEVWRAPGPPAPSNIKFLRKFRISPPFRLRPAEVGKFRSRLAFTNSGRRSGGRPALQHPRASNSCGSSAFRLPPDRAPWGSEFFSTVSLSSIGEAGNISRTLVCGRLVKDANASYS